MGLRIYIDRQCDLSSYAVVAESETIALRQRGETVCEVQPSTIYESPCVVYRLRNPLDFRGCHGIRTFVFATAETNWLPAHRFLGGRRQVIGEKVIVTTPSQFSKLGLCRSGFPPEKVFVVPHGVSPEFRYLRRPILDTQKGKFQGFHFINVGNCEGRKGLDLLLMAFAIVVKRYDFCRLIIKGLDQVYPSKLWFNHTWTQLPQHVRQTLEGRVQYIGESFHATTLSRVFNFAQCYVSPYRAEAFNLPVLEALACGLPVICTKGGPTDDFRGYGPLHFVESNVVRRGIESEEEILEPDLDDLAAKMLAVVDGPRRSEEDKLRVTKFIQYRFSWDRTASQLVELFNRSDD